MAYQVTTINADGSREYNTIRNKQISPTLLEVIKDRLGGGYLQIVPEFTDYGARQCIAFCDEEGKLKGLPLNPKATYLWYACMAPQPFRQDTLHGPIVIVTADTPEEFQAI
jgi:hypothetical protein